MWIFEFLICVTEELYYLLSVGQGRAIGQRPIVLTWRGRPDMNISAFQYQSINHLLRHRCYYNPVN